MRIYIYIEMSYVPSSNHDSPLRCRAITTTIAAGPGARRRTQPANCHHHHIVIVAVIVTPLVPSYGAAGSMVAPFAVGAASPKVTCYPATLWERAEARVSAAARVARSIRRRPTRLDEDGIDVRRLMRSNLSWGYTAAYELDILPWEGQDRPRLRAMRVGCELPATHDEDRVSALGSGGNSGVVEDEGPASYRAVRSRFSPGT